MAIFSNVFVILSLQAGLGLVLLPLLVIPIAKKHGLNVWLWSILTFLFHIFALVFFYHRIGKKGFSYFLAVVCAVYGGLLINNLFS